MTPKEKAIELFDKYYNDSYYITLAEARELSLIAVDLAIEYSDFHIEFLQEVKQEIKKL